MQLLECVVKGEYGRSVRLSYDAMLGCVKVEFGEGDNFRADIEQYRYPPFLNDEDKLWGWASMVERFLACRNCNGTGGDIRPVFDLLKQLAEPVLC